MSSIRNTGVFGGSFDPPHLGHLLGSTYALKMFELDEVWWVPAYEHAFGKDLSPFDLRVDLCREMIADLGQGFKVCEIESELKNGGRMFETLNALKSKHSNRRFALVIGSDLQEELPRWYKSEELQRTYRVCTIPRSPQTQKDLAIPNISSTTLRSLENETGDAHHWIPRSILEKWRTNRSKT